ncbi:acyl-protein synthetase [Dyella flagellata]
MAQPVYGLPKLEKSQLLAEILTRLTWHHASACPPYARILEAHGHSGPRPFALEDIPFLPVRLFKDYELSSIPDDQRFKVLTSSGTTSQRVSKIILDRNTSTLQTRALISILQQFLGKARLPMLIIDHPGVIKDRKTFSARGAGILGLSNFGRNHAYALRDEDLAPDMETIARFMQAHRGQRILLFGFTFMVWKHFYKPILDSGISLSFEDAILIHSGGWKKLQEEAVENEIFKASLKQALNITAVHNFYGMVEQVGSIFMECEYGRLHTPAFADVLVRNPRDWSVLPKGVKGLIQVLSLLPSSYPGHSLLTEDVGEWTGEDDCPCGRLGRTFKVYGRMAQAELRGCGDTHAAMLEEGPIQS